MHGEAIRQQAGTHSLPIGGWPCGVRHLAGAWFSARARSKQMAGQAEVSGWPQQSGTVGYL